MITISGDKIFALTNRHFSYVFQATEEGVLHHLYYGEPLRDPTSVPVHHLRTQREATTNFEGVEHLNLSDLPQEYPTFGRSDFRAPAFHARNSDGNSVFSFRYKSYRVTPGKPSCADLPSARGGNSETLIITLEDHLYGVEVELFYTIYAEYGVLVRSAKIHNHGNEAVELSHIFSSSLDLPADEYEIIIQAEWSIEFRSQTLLFQIMAKAYQKRLKI